MIWSSVSNWTEIEFRIWTAWNPNRQLFDAKALIALSLQRIIFSTNYHNLHLLTQTKTLTIRILAISILRQVFEVALLLD